MSKGAIIGGVTFVVFMAEAIVHYNGGARAVDPTHKYGIPPMNKLVPMGLVVIGASIISTVLIGALTAKN